MAQSADAMTALSLLTSTSITSRQVVTHTVDVAKGGHTFSPEVTQAQIGDIIEFNFYPTNHSVIRAEYGYPCVPYERTGVDKVGFFSGIKPVDAILDNPPKYNLLVNDSNPIFFYCGAAGSCINYQMVGVINPNATTSLVTQKRLAAESQFMLLPGEPWPSEENNPFTPAPATAAATSTSQAVASATPSLDGNVHHHTGLSIAAIAGIAIGGAVVVLVAAVLLYLCGRGSRRNSRSLPPVIRTQSHTQGQFSPQDPSPYLDPTKHVSMQTQYVSSALPGYVPPQGPTLSPPLHSPYTNSSDALIPGIQFNPTMATALDTGSQRTNSVLYPAPLFQRSPHTTHAELSSDSHIDLFPSLSGRNDGSNASTASSDTESISRHSSPGPQNYHHHHSYLFPPSPYQPLASRTPSPLSVPSPPPMFIRPLTPQRTSKGSVFVESVHEMSAVPKSPEQIRDDSSDLTKNNIGARTSDINGGGHRDRDMMKGSCRLDFGFERR